MAYTIPTAYPTTTAMGLIIAHSPIGEDEWDSVVQRQHFVFRHRRTRIISKNFERVRGSATAKLGFQTSALTSTNPFLFIPITSSLWTPDDHDSTVNLVVRARYAVTGPGGTGTVRVIVDYAGGPQTYNISKAAVVAPAPFAWDSLSQAVNKNLSAVGIALHLLVSAGTNTVECRQLELFVDEQGTIGV